MEEYLKHIQISWVDLAILILLIVGMVRGRKRGVSEEFLDVSKWLVVILLGCYLYRPLGMMLASVTPFSRLSCYMTVYALILLGVFMIFSHIKKSFGEKIVASDAFGDGEYYLGIFAGFFRYFFVILIVLNFINARHFQPHEANARVQSQLKNFGMVFFTMPEFQNEIFVKSMSGRLIGDYLSFFMIEPTPAEDKDIRNDNNRRGVRARERQFNQILE